MYDQTGTRNLPDADVLMEAIHRKLMANRPVLEKSLSYGRVIWRFDRKSGQFEVDLEPKI